MGSCVELARRLFIYFYLFILKQCTSINSRLLQSVAHIKKLPWNNLMSKLFTVILTKEIRIRNKKVKEKMEDFDFEIPVLTYEMWNKGVQECSLD